ncbi:MAG TPA: hypothetical protein VMD07_06765 [Candidatus Acidoferrales bacterium]|nr:hypothetical protein [Candidatus Acidoferrales bacterium]
MPRWQSALAILAILCVAGTFWPWAALYRIACAAAAFALIIAVLVSRLQQHAAAMTSSRATIKQLESRIDDIRSQREQRYRRR